MRILLLALFALAWTTPVLADSPTAGDLIYWDDGGCRLMHHNPTTSVTRVVSKWGACGGSDVGAGPTNWFPDAPKIYVRPDGWIYITGWSLPNFDALLYRINATTGDREFVTGIPTSDSGAYELAIWPEPSFFPPTVAALSMGAAVLLGVALAGVSRHRAKKDPVGD